jgi:hypothetical protein
VPREAATSTARSSGTASGRRRFAPLASPTAVSMTAIRSHRGQLPAASSDSEAEQRAVEALERWASGPGAGWRAVGVTHWVEDGARTSRSVAIQYSCKTRGCG